MILRDLVYVLAALLMLAIVLAGAQMRIIERNIRKMSYDIQPFTRHAPGAALRFLFIGDSTAVGTGAKNNSESVAGYFGRDFPQAAIDNNSYNGRKLTQLVREFPTDVKVPYDLVIVQIGGNDIMQLTPIESIGRDITTVITQAKTIGRHVVILHSGNVGLAPIFIWPFDALMTARARAVRRLYMNKARENGVLYVDLFTERNNDLFLKDIAEYYCADHLHPSAQGYRWWYERIRATMTEGHVVL